MKFLQSTKDRTRRSYKRALRQAGPDEMVCWTRDTRDKDRYFVMPRTASDREIAARAFQIKTGRTVGMLEEVVMDYAEKLRA